MELRNILNIIRMFKSPYLTGSLYVNTLNISLDFINTIAQVTLFSAVGGINLINTVYVFKQVHVIQGI